MRALRISEIILLVLTFTVVFTVVNAIMWSDYKERVKKVTEQKAQLEDQITTNMAYAAQEAEWLPKNEWLDEHMPKMGDFGEEQSALLEYLQESAKERGVRLRSQTLLKPEGGSAHHRVVSVTIDSIGPDQAIYSWLSEMQSPEKFQYFKYLQLDSNESSKPKLVMDCRFTLSRWYRP